MTEGSGGEILPGSVHASLGYARTRADASAGTKSVPIHVVWKNASVEGIGWWMTQLIVGPDGSPAQTMYPVKVDVIPSGSAGHASILGYEDPGGDVVEVLWSERTDDAGEPAFGPSCPSKKTIHVQWWAMRDAQGAAVFRVKR